MNQITLSAVFLGMYDILDCCCYGYVFPLLWYTILYKQLSVVYNREKHVHQRNKKKKHCYFLYIVIRKNENKKCDGKISKCLMFQTRSFLVESYRDFVCFVFVNVPLSQINKATKSESWMWNISHEVAVLGKQKANVSPTRHFQTATEESLDMCPSPHVRHHVSVITRLSPHVHHHVSIITRHITWAQL